MATTVYVVPRRGKRNIELRWIDPDTGKWRSRSAGTKVKREAERQAAKIEQQIADGTFSENVRSSWEDFTHRYKTEHLESLAKASYTKVVASLHWVERVLRPKLVKSINTAALSKLAREMRAGGKYKYPDGRVIKPLSEATIKSHLVKIRAALQWAYDMDIIDKVPDIPKIRRAKRSTGRSPMKGRPITLEEFERMLEHCPSDRWRFLLNGLWLSGLRLGEAAILTWDGTSGFTLDMKTARYPMFKISSESEKGKKDRLLPLTPDFEAMLLEVPVRRRFGLVFNLPNRDGNQLQVDAISKKVSKIGEAAGVVVAEDKYASAQDLRRSFGDRWSSKMMPADLQQLMRHESIETTMRYYVKRQAESLSESLRQVSEDAQSCGNPCALD